MIKSTPDNQRLTNRIGPSVDTATVHGLTPEPLPAAVLDESFGGLGLAIPFQCDPKSQLNVAVMIEIDEVKTTALIRHVVPLPSGSRIGIEWKAQAVSRCFHQLAQLSDKAASDPLNQILPGGLSFMWKLFESGKFHHMLQSADRLRREAVACNAPALTAPIERFQSQVGSIVDTHSEADIRDLAQRELNLLIEKCVENSRRS